jgi:hypothetical protein
LKCEAPALELKVQTAGGVGGGTPTNSDEYQNKGLTKFAFHKRLILKGLDCSAVAEIHVEPLDRQ